MANMSSFWKIICIVVAVFYLVFPSTANAASTFEFRKPTGLSNPSVTSTRFTVPNDKVFDDINELNTRLVRDIRTALLAEPAVLKVNSLTVQFPNPSLVLTGVGRSLQITLAGINKVRASIQVRPEDSLARAVCGSSVRATLDINNLLLIARYNYFNGFLEDTDIRYSNLDADLNCSNPLGDLFLKIADLAGLDLDDLVADEIRKGASSLRGDYSNVFSLEEALANFETSGNREIREVAEDALAYLGGLRSAVAAVIAENLREDLIERLNLDNQAEIDAFLDRLVDLQPYISLSLTGLDSINLDQTDLSNYLQQNLPNLEAYLLSKLDNYYQDAVDAVRRVEVQAFNALEDLVQTDWSNIFGGINFRLRIYRGQQLIIVDAYHSSPKDFVGRAEAVAPCSPEYTFSAVDNAVNYRVWNSNDDIYYSGRTPRSLRTRGLLNSVTVKGRQGLYSYPKKARIQLYGWADYAGDPSTFRWPSCPIADLTNPTPTPTPSTPPTPTPSTPPYRPSPPPGGFIP